MVMLLGASGSAQGSRKYVSLSPALQQIEHGITDYMKKKRGYMVCTGDYVTTNTRKQKRAARSYMEGLHGDACWQASSTFLVPSGLTSKVPTEVAAQAWHRLWAAIVITVITHLSTASHAAGF
jgi:hypothetical protein